MTARLYCALGLLVIMFSTTVLTSYQAGRQSASRLNDIEREIEYQKGYRDACKSILEDLSKAQYQTFDA